MPKILDDSFFDSVPLGDSDDSNLPDLHTPSVRRGTGLNQVTDYLVKRSEAFQRMTIGKGKPMIYGALSKKK